jgi:signal peptidase II
VLLATTAAVVAIDLVSKVLAVGALQPEQLVLPGLTIRVVYNRALLLGFGHHRSPLLLILIPAAVSVAILLAGWTLRLRPPVAAGLIAGGAIANVLDRAYDGSVVDLIDVGSWPIFNLADAALLMGAAVLLFSKDLPASSGESPTNRARCPTRWLRAGHDRRSGAGSAPAN